ncbi:MAG: hypothetical protein V3T49_00995 [Dehalococcoidia bacterium]
MMFTTAQIRRHLEYDIPLPTTRESLRTSDFTTIFTNLLNAG